MKWHRVIETRGLPPSKDTPAFGPWLMSGFEGVTWQGTGVAGLALLATAVALSGCASVTCGDRERSVSADAPRVETFDVATQMSGDPWMVVFAVGFSDRDGDLYGGVAEFFVNSQGTPTTQPLDEVFLQSAVPPGATAGRLGIPLRFGEGLDDGARVRLGLQLVDEAEYRSNCFTLELRFEVDQVARNTAPHAQPPTRRGFARLLHKVRSCT